MSETSGEKKTGNVCDFCGEQTATVLCPECYRCYCSECNEYIHKRETKRGHKTEGIPQGMMVDAVCPHHKTDLKLFCVDDMELCCFECTSKKLHEGHKVVELSEISKDDEGTFSMERAMKLLGAALDRDSALYKRMEEEIDNIRKESDDVRAKIAKAFEEAHKKLEAEETEMISELERVSKEAEDTLISAFNSLRAACEYNDALSEMSSKLQGKCSKLMEMNVVCKVEKQRKIVEELHKTELMSLSIGWDNERRKLSLAKHIFNGAPVPSNISFPVVLSTSFDIKWDCDDYNNMDEENRERLAYTVEVRKSGEGDNEWRKVYSGKDKKCAVLDVDMDTEHEVRVKCAIGELSGAWSDVAKVKTELTQLDSVILSGEVNKDMFVDKLGEWCRCNSFALLYRGSRDGFNASDFHRTCDNKGKTLVLVKNTSGHIFGGYASIPWARSAVKGSYMQAPGSFLFTLTNVYMTEPVKFPLKKENNSNAVFCKSDYGPTFGNGHDLHIASSSNTNTNSRANFSTYYDTIDKGNVIFSSKMSNNFQVQEIEVYKIN